jgi:apolipoprotein N-acyltransferase
VTLRRAALAAAGGLALFAGHPPIGLGWLGLLAVAPLAALARDLHRSGARARAGLGWGTAAGAIFFTPLIGWITAIGEWVAWPLLAVVQGLFVGVFVAALVAWGDRRWRPLAVVVAWVAVEAVRSVAPLGGFAWGVLGYTQATGGPLLGIARSLGVLGVSAACAAVGASVEEALARMRRPLTDRALTGPDRGIAAFGVAQTPILAVLAVLVGGVLLAGEPPAPTGATVDVAGIQGVEEDTTGRVLTRSVRIAEDMRAATEAALDPDDLPDVVVWAENAVDGDPTRTPELGEPLARTIALLDGRPLLTGVIEAGDEPGTHRNSMLLYDGSTEVADRYVKRRLVPFGEYVPARGLLDWYPPLARVPSDGIPGTEPEVFDAAGARIGVGICFDVVYPRFFHEQVRDGADLLVLATNNVSYGRTPMSDQHIAFSQLRAVETGRWVVHVALSGRSALVDPTGRVHQRTGQYERAVVRADVPLVDGITLATRVGDGVSHLALALAALGLGVLARDRWRARRGRTPAVDAADRRADAPGAPEPGSRTGAPAAR